MPAPTAIATPAGGNIIPTATAPAVNNSLPGSVTILVTVLTTALPIPLKNEPIPSRIPILPSSLPSVHSLFAPKTTSPALAALSSAPPAPSEPSVPCDSSAACAAVFLKSLIMFS